MNYELAKKLKDAGFPFKKLFIDDLDYYIPTLSELIEACDPKSGKFGDFYLQCLGSKLWNAGFTVFHVNPRVEVDSHRFEGSTPEEAVANLYLALKGV